MNNLDLSGLKDIHLPVHELGIFPIAFGWWILLSLPVIVFLMVKVYSYLKKQSARFYARLELDSIMKSSISLQDKAIKISVLLKRVAIKKYGSQNIADLYGKNWAEFISEKACLSDGEDNKIAEFIASASYLNHHNLPSVNADKLSKISSEFIRRTV